jgi:hypothetical protein
MAPKLKVIFCQHTMAKLAAADHLATRLKELLDHGWMCRMAHFAKEQATVWVEPKPGGPKSI